MSRAPDGMTDAQHAGICALLGKLDRCLPAEGIGHLTFDEAGDLIVELRAELLALTEGAETRCT